MSAKVVQQRNLDHYTELLTFNTESLNFVGVLTGFAGYIPNYVFAKPCRSTCRSNGTYCRTSCHTMRHTRRISSRSLSPVSFHISNSVSPLKWLNRLILIFFFFCFMLVHSDWDRNVELAQLIQQKLDAYKAGKSQNRAKHQMESILI